MAIICLILNHIMNKRSQLYHFNAFMLSISAESDRLVKHMFRRFVGHGIDHWFIWPSINTPPH